MEMIFNSTCEVSGFEYCTTCAEPVDATYDGECVHCYADIADYLVAMVVEYQELCARDDDHCSYGNALDIAYGLTGAKYPDGIRPVFMTENDPDQR